VGALLDPGGLLVIAPNLKSWPGVPRLGIAKASLGLSCAARSAGTAFILGPALPAGPEQWRG
jgi:hypothetical protein